MHRKKEQYSMKRINVYGVILGIIAVVVLLSACAAKYSRIVILDEYDLQFGMSPAEVASKLGDPVESDTSMLVANRSSYLYHTTLLEYSAKIWCEFVDDRNLSRTYIQWSLDSDDQANKIIEKAEQMIRDKYQNHKNYFWKSEDWQDYEYSVSTGIDYGATGFFYKIKKSENIVYIDCIAHF